MSQGDDVAMVYFGLHGVAGDIAPEAGFFESPYYDVGGGYVYLRVEHLIESPNKVHIVVWCADRWFMDVVGMNEGLASSIVLMPFKSSFNMLPAPVSNHPVEYRG